MVKKNVVFWALLQCYTNFKNRTKELLKNPENEAEKQNDDELEHKLWQRISSIVFLGLGKLVMSYLLRSLGGRILSRCVLETTYTCNNPSKM